MIPGIHKTVNEKIGRASSGGTVPMGKAKEISTKEASKRSGCSAKELRKQLDEGVAAADDTLIRGEKDARKVTEEIANKIKPPTQKPGDFDERDEW